MSRLAVALVLGFAMICPIGSGDFGAPTGPSATTVRRADAAQPRAHHSRDPLAWLAMLSAFGLLGAMLRVRPETGAK